MNISSGKVDVKNDPAARHMMEVFCASYERNANRFLARVNTTLASIWKTKGRKRYGLGLVMFVVFLTAGCASQHRKLTAQTAVLGQPFLRCHADNSCEWVQNWQVPGRPDTTQLTPPGCLVHMIATFGHVPWECRSVKANCGRWLWKSGKCKKTATVSQQTEPIGCAGTVRGCSVSFGMGVPNTIVSQPSKEVPSGRTP